MDSKPRDELDQHFAARLQLRCPQVLNDIDRAYGDPMRHLIQSRLTPALREADAQEIFQDALLDLWDKYPPENCSISIRSFLYKQVRWKSIDKCRRRRGEITECCVGESDEAVSISNCTLLDGLVCQENADLEARILIEIDNTLPSLPENQSLAFRRRFHGPASSRWAKELEEETGVSASSWRKACDDALNKIRKHLVRCKLLRREGGRYEVA